MDVSGSSRRARSAARNWLLVLAVAHGADGQEGLGRRPARQNLPSRASREFIATYAGFASPESILLDASGKIDVHVARLSRAEGCARVVFSFAPDAQDLFVPVHDSGWLRVPHPPHGAFGTTVSLPEPERRRGRWRIDVFDEMEGGPTGEYPYALQVTVHGEPDRDGRPPVFVAVPPRNSYDTERKIDPDLSCLRLPTLASLRPAAAVERLWHAPDLPLTEVGTSLLARGGRSLYLTLASEESVSVEARLAVKPFGGGPFVSVCTFDVTTSSSGGAVILAGRFPWNLNFFPVWRVELRARPAPGATSDGNVTAHVEAAAFRDEDPERREWEVLQGMWSLTMSRFVCAGGGPREQRAWSRETPEHRFARRTRLSLRLAGDFSASQKAELTASVLEALGIWSAQCSVCNYDAIGVAEIEGSLFARRELLEGIAAIVGGQGEGESRLGSRTLPDVFWLHRAARTPEMIMEGGPVYVPVACERPEVAALCATPSTTLPEELRRVMSALGCPGAPPTTDASEIALYVTITSTNTSCGTSANIVACEADPNLLELNGRDFAFVSASGAILGSGRTKVELLHVLLHEVGHLLGLGHSREVEAMMASSLQDSRCINTADREALARVIALGHDEVAEGAGPRAFLWRSSRDRTVPVSSPTP